MIARIWKGRAQSGTAEDYRRHATRTVFPALAGLTGHRGACLLERDLDGETEFTVLTFWDSTDSVKAFAGDDISVAVVEPEGRAALTAFDDFAIHYEVAFKAP